MSNAAVNLAWAQDRICPLDKLILLAICDRVQPGRNAVELEMRDIARQCNSQDKEVNRAVQRLERAGMITRKTNLYVLRGGA